MLDKFQEADILFSIVSKTVKNPKRKRYWSNSLDQPKFYPTEKSVLLEPLCYECQLQFKIDGLTYPVLQEQCAVKFALPAKGKFSQPQHQNTVKQILAKILDAPHFEISNEFGQVCLSVPVRMIPAEMVTRNIRAKVPVLVKLNCTTIEPIELKCIQELNLQIMPDTNES